MEDLDYTDVSELTGEYKEHFFGKKPKDNEFKSEKEFIAHLHENIIEIGVFLDLPKIKEVRIEVPLDYSGLKVKSWRTSKARADIVIFHEDDSITIIEAKKGTIKHDAFSGITQLLYYKMLMEYQFKSVINMVLATETIHPDLVKMTQLNSLDINFIGVTKDLLTGSKTLRGLTI